MNESPGVSTPPEGVRPGASLLDTVALVLTIVGGLNWAVVGLLELDVVAMLFGAMTAATRVVYVLIGLSAAYSLLRLPGLKRIP